MVKCVPDKKRADRPTATGLAVTFAQQLCSFSAAALGAIILSFPAAFLSLSLSLKWSFYTQKNPETTFDGVKVIRIQGALYFGSHCACLLIH